MPILWDVSDPYIYGQCQHKKQKGRNKVSKLPGFNAERWNPI